MTRINKRQARKLFAEGQTFLACPEKRNPKSANVITRINPKKYGGWSEMIDDWTFRNASREAGFRPNFYVG